LLAQICLKRVPADGVGEAVLQGFLLVPVGKGSTMEKWMCLGAIGVAVITFLVFTIDLFVGFPFSNGTAGYDSPFGLADGSGMIGAMVLGYLGWNAYRDLK
jgi:hypothetical protein